MDSSKLTLKRQQKRIKPWIVSLILVMLGVPANAEPTSQSSATIHISGEIRNPACTAAIKGANDATVNIGKVFIHEFGEAAGSEAIGRGQKFTLSLTHCDPAEDIVIISMTGTECKDGLLMLSNRDSAATAKGVAIQVKPANGGSLLCGRQWMNLKYTNGDKVDFDVNYVSTEPRANIQAGIADALATFQLEYR